MTTVARVSAIVGHPGLATGSGWSWSGSGGARHTRFPEAGNVWPRGLVEDSERLWIHIAASPRFGLWPTMTAKTSTILNLWLVMCPKTKASNSMNRRSCGIHKKALTRQTLAASGTSTPAAAAAPAVATAGAVRQHFCSYGRVCVQSVTRISNVAFSKRV